MPREVFGADHAFLPRSEILSFEEITRVAAVFVRLGVEKIRLTGGEPLLRRELPLLVGALSQLEGVSDLAVTTNGALLAQHAGALRDAGLRRVTVSLDSLDPRTFAAMNDTSVPVATVIAGIEAARGAGFAPIKINTVIKRGVNEESIIDLPRRFAGPDYVVRFIEYMDVGMTNGWQREHVVSAAEIVERLSKAFGIEPLPCSRWGETARRFRNQEGGGEIGIISSVTHPFCRDCVRARLSADGRLFTCLFSGEGTDLRALLREGTDANVSAAIERVWISRADRYSEQRAHAAPSARKPEMSLLGG